MEMVILVLGLFGFLSILVKKDVLGVIVGFQLMVLGATASFVYFGVRSGDSQDGHVFGLMIALSAIIQLSLGFAIMARLFRNRGRSKLEDIELLKH